MRLERAWSRRVGSARKVSSVPVIRSGARVRSPPDRSGWRCRGHFGVEDLGIQRKAPLVCAGEDEEVVGERDKAVGLLRGAFKSRGELLRGSACGERQVELCLEHREGGSKLVACVGNECPLSFERELDAGEHLVESLSEVRDLIARCRDGEALAAPRARDLGGARSHVLDGAEGSRDEQVGEDRSEEERDGPADDEDPGEAVEGLVAAVERSGDDRCVAPAVVPREVGDEAKLLAFEVGDRLVHARFVASGELRDLFGREKRLTQESFGCGVGNRSIGLEDLDEALVVHAVEGVLLGSPRSSPSSTMIAATPARRADSSRSICSSRSVRWRS